MEARMPFHCHVKLTALPRPDHPSEREPILLRVDLIAHVAMGDFNYTPAENAPVALLPNNKALKGRAPAVFMVYGASFFVTETVKEVWEKIAAAQDGAPPFSAVER